MATTNLTPFGLCECGCGQRTAIARDTIPRNRAIRGQPHRFRSGHQNRRDPVQAFWKYVGPISRMTDCWHWQGYRNRDGYGAISINGTRTGAHRLAWQVAFGAIQAGLCVLHRCDHPPCVNPRHLFLGTQTENTSDKVAKSRQNRGEHHGRAKLTDADVITIRASTDMGQALAHAYGVGESAISKVRLRQSWRHI